MIGKNHKRNFSFFYKTGIVVVSDCFGRKNQVYTSIVGIIRESGSYDIAVKTMATTIMNLLDLIWLLQKVILQVSATCVPLHQRKLKHVNF